MRLSAVEQAPKCRPDLGGGGALQRRAAAVMGRVAFLNDTVRDLRHILSRVSGQMKRIGIERPWTFP